MWHGIKVEGLFSGVVWKEIFEKTFWIDFAIYKNPNVWNRKQTKLNFNVIKKVTFIGCLHVVFYLTHRDRRSSQVQKVITI